MSDQVGHQAPEYWRQAGYNERLSSRGIWAVPRPVGSSMEELPPKVSPALVSTLGRGALRWVPGLPPTYGTVPTSEPTHPHFQPHMFFLLPAVG